ncbi:MAG: hypothetical protein MUC38_02400 [Cyclobacteriaceae bacterium]|nr:hypothetical protein [Cyclobacteriaceae bacterium]
MSRVPPKMKQAAARKAGLYEVLPISDNGITYSIEVVISEKPKTSNHFVKAVGADGTTLWTTLVHTLVYNEFLEGDVQDVFVVDLFTTAQHVGVAFEYHGTVLLDRATGAVVA